MPECHQTANIQECNCTYHPCPRKGICCECIKYHRKMHQLPACYFSPEIEKTYDRSIKNFIRSYQK